MWNLPQKKRTDRNDCYRDQLSLSNEITEHSFAVGGRRRCQTEATPLGNAPTPFVCFRLTKEKPGWVVRNQKIPDENSYFPFLVIEKKT